MQVQLLTLIAVYLDVSGFFWTLPVLFGNGFNF
jgi:hypothetical protein